MSTSSSVSSGENRTKILVISHKPPYPAIDGGTIAMASLLHLLINGNNDVTLFCLGTRKHPFHLEAFPEQVVKDTRILHHTIDTDPKLSHAGRVLFSKKSYQASRFFNPGAAAKISAAIRASPPDIVIFESLYAAVYLPLIAEHPQIRTLLRSHNMEYRIREQAIAKEASFLKKTVLRNENRKLQSFESEVLRSVDGILSISDTDLAEIRSIAPSVPSLMVPFTIDPQKYPLRHVQKKPGENLRLFHIGAMDWEPNREAMQWFLHEIFPVLRRRFPGIEFHMAGKSMGNEFLQMKKEDVTVHGEVADAAAFMHAHHLMVVPLKSGSGIRIKIVEAMAMGIPVISTSCGLQGIPAHDGIHALIAEDADGFSQQVERLHNDPGLLEQIGARGAALARGRFAEANVAVALQGFISGIVNGIR